MAHTPLHTVLGHVRTLAAADLTDAELLERFLRRQDQAAFADLVKRHGPLVQRVCWRVLGHAQDVEDAFQATFLVLARSAVAIRKREGLAGWLHGVAYRIALRARRDAGRRRRREREAQRMTHDQPSLDAAWRELQTVLDEEITKLPEIYRIVFVLCCLESKSKPEAAEQLGLKEGTVSSRLAHARKLLQRQLRRRGLTLSAVLSAAAVSEETCRAALPSLLATGTVKAAVSPTVTALAEGVSKTMFTSKGKYVVGLILALGLTVAGVGVLAQRPKPPQEAGEPPKTIKERPVAGAPGLEETADAVTIRGRVLDPDGKPFAGANLYLGWRKWTWHGDWTDAPAPLRPARGGVSGSDGRFCFTFTKREINAAMRTPTANPWRESQVVAAAKGYGPAWRELSAKERGEWTLRLARDEVPIKGRILDLQGGPVAGARVWVVDVHIAEGNRWLHVVSGPGLPDAVKTDKDGRFVLSGVGRDREVRLHVAGPTIAHQFVSASTSAKEKPPLEIIAGPTKPLAGTVRAKDTGKPLAGVVVYGDRRTHHDAVRAVTDSEGRYRLIGLPKKASYSLTFLPAEGQPYLAAELKVADNVGLETLQFDAELRRGVPVHLRLIDKETRQPVRAVVDHTPLMSNPLHTEAAGGPGFLSVHTTKADFLPDDDGSYHLVVYPGLGTIFVSALHAGRPYLPAKYDPEDIKKGYDRDRVMYMHMPVAEGYRIINTDKTDETLRVTIELDPGRTVKGTLLDADGKPVKGATASGWTYEPLRKWFRPFWPSSEEHILKSENFTAGGVATDVPRIIQFVHAERKLIGRVLLRGDEKTPVVVRMQSCGVLTGRLVDDKRKPLPDVEVQLNYPAPTPGMEMLQSRIEPPPQAMPRRMPKPAPRRPEPLQGLSLQGCWTDREGRFRIEGLIPGQPHQLTLRPLDRTGAVMLSAGDALKDVSVGAGEVKSLGDIAVKVSKQ
ncbi:MAG TPA: sigma-70 family RNA polymerase sigma factor [Gemmataceae bacterium]